MALPRPTRRVKTNKKEVRVPTTTTIKVSRRVMKHIETKSLPDESVDETLRRLLKLATTGTPKPQGPLPMTTTIKVSKVVMAHIRDSAKEKESRDMTLGRLLGVQPEDGNFPAPASAGRRMDRKSVGVQPKDGNLQVHA